MTLLRAANGKLYFDVAAQNRAPLTRTALGDDKVDRTWYRVARSNKKVQEADVYIYAEIGMWGITAQDLVQELSELDVKTINVRINSPGGSVFDGIAIYNALAQHDARVVVYIEGYAASIASVIAMAGDEINIAEAAQVMIHKPWSFAIGSADDMRKEADILDQIQDNIVDIYVARTAGDRTAIVKQVNDETWFRAQQAIDAGFADKITPSKTKPKAEDDGAAAGDVLFFQQSKPCTRLGAEFFAQIFRHMPDDIVAAIEQVEPTAETPAPKDFDFSKATPRDFERLLRAAGASRSQAAAIAKQGFKPGTDSRDETVPVVTPHVDPRDEDAERAARIALIMQAADANNVIAAINQATESHRAAAAKLTHK